MFKYSENTGHSVHKMFAEGLKPKRGIHLDKQKNERKRSMKV